MEVVIEIVMNLRQRWIEAAIEGGNYGVRKRWSEVAVDGGSGLAVE